MPDREFICPSCQLAQTIADDQPLPRCPRCRADLSAEVAGTTASVEPVDLEATRLASAASDVAVEQSARIGRFEIRRRLGEGAFGAVYEAYDPQLERAVALKVAKLQAGDAAQRVKRFLREAKAAAGLRHANIVPVHEFGQDGDHFFIVSALIHGSTLQADLAGRSSSEPDVKRAARIARQLAEALAYAHGVGIVHRDVKPGNVMLDDKDEPMLMDFGLATRPDDAEKLTHAGAVLGTPLYMAPEQALGDGAGAASDQYSLGVVLYEMIAGKPPFAGKPEWVMVQHIEEEPVSPRRLNPAVSRDLETICLKCLRKEPGQRYANCRDLADDLTRFLGGQPVRARPVSAGERSLRWVRRHPARVGVVMLTLLVAALGAYVVARKPDVPAGEPPPRVEVRQPVSRHFDYVEVEGKVVSQFADELKAKVASHLEIIKYRGGEYVTGGQPLFGFDSRAAKANVKTAQDSFNRLQARWRETAAALAKEKERAKNDPADAELKKAEAEHQKLQAEIAASQKNLDKCMADVAACNVAATMDGYITRPYVVLGQLVKVGDPLATIESAKIALDFTIDETRMRDCRPAMEKLGFVIRYQTAGKDFDGVARIGVADLPRDGKISIQGDIDVPLGPDKRPIYLPRGPTRVRLPAIDRDTLMVPDTAILAVDNRKVLRIVGDDNIVKQIDVIPGDLDADGLRAVHEKKGSDFITDRSWIIVEGADKARVNYPVEPIRIGKVEPPRK